MYINIISNHDIVRSTLSILVERFGKRLSYQDSMSA